MRRRPDANVHAPFARCVTGTSSAPIGKSASHVAQRCTRCATKPREISRTASPKARAGARRASRTGRRPAIAGVASTRMTRVAPPPRRCRVRRKSSRSRPLRCRPTSPAQTLPQEKKPSRAHAEPPAPVGPIEAKIPAITTRSSWSPPGKGKKEALELSAKAGNKQAGRARARLHAQAVGGAQSAEEVVPTIVLGGDAETKTAEGRQLSSTRSSINRTDARETTGAKIPTRQVSAPLTRARRA